MNVTIEINTTQFKRQFRRLKNSSFAFGIKNASDRAGRFFIKSLQREWNRKMDVKRRSFPRSVMRVKRALVNASAGIVVRPTEVRNIAADEALRAQIFGATRRPDKSRAFVVPTGRSRRISRRLKTFTAGKYIFAYNSRGDRLVGTLEPRIRVDGTINLRKVANITARTFGRLLNASLARELRFRSR